MAAYYMASSSTPPPPPPKQQSPSRSSGFVNTQGPPLPPPPRHNELSELDGNHAHRPHSSLSRPHQQSFPQPDVPPIGSHWLPEILKDKSVNDLQEILNSPSLQSFLLNSPHTTHPSVPISEQHLAPLIQSNVSAASQLLDTEDRLSALRERTQSRLLALRALEQQHRSKISETETALRDFSPQALYQRLNASVQEQELLLRGLEESWLYEDGVASDRDVSDFVRRAKEARKTAFLRRERKSRWDDGRVGGWR
ncbi:Putative modifier of rudimentary, Modr, ESCRT assembly domain-containing protein [Septoria linicola]|uniref:Modifier of rudimentary, Modr, ESCRT assembly domain-containing protein n=1 Tax=Septoria linicola TaxID=215465 RepID=A0A9Q9EFB9_9PEZI|nr:putative modifier of rudimentary, Modr, ESCRT assembly domain-containing protein [Septoria linicola]USW47492.1 Putative modifier of rudimentary, Modr, ESCRT assembly domain-containing protein [Septoria linicola]